MGIDASGLFDPAEDCAERTPREILARNGFVPVSPTELNDTQLTGRLWEWLYACAARRFFFHGTDHLSDRQFYALLWEQWLDQPTADIPLEAETNTTLFVNEFAVNGMTVSEIWSKYYDEAQFGDKARREKLPFDRDRFLPTPPIPLEAHAGWLEGDDDVIDVFDEEPDLLGLADVDKEIAAEKGVTDPMSPDHALQSQLSASEPENWVPPGKKLAEENIPLLPPQELTDESLTPILWELLHNLSLGGFYLLHTNHLSDRELYAELWERGLRDPAHFTGRNPRGGWFHDILGSWGDDEMQLWLRFYATDEERAKHAQQYPKDIQPNKETPIANRDWRLPKGPIQ